MNLFDSYAVEWEGGKSFVVRPLREVVQRNKLAALGKVEVKHHLVVAIFPTLELGMEFVTQIKRLIEK